MGVNAEGKISLSVELQNFKDIASDLKKGLSAQLKQVPLDIEFNNKDLEKKAAEAVKNINEIISKSRVKNLDLSSILPNFVNEINKEGISDEIRMQMIKGFESALTNLRDIGIKQDYSKLKGFNGEDLKAYIADLNDVMDILKTIEGLTERQKQGILTTVLPSLSSLNGRGKDAAKKEYTKGAKRLDAILQLSGDYNDVLQYGVNPTATLSALNELNKKAKSGKRLTKNEGQDLLGYLLRGKFLGLEFGKAEDESLKDLDYKYLLQSAQESLDEATVKYIENKSAEYFAALDRIYKSSAQEITYSDLTKGIKNTTNQKMQNMFDTEAPENPPTRIRAGSITKRAIKLSSKEKPELRKRTQDEDEKYKKNTEKTESQFEDTDEEKLIQDYKNQIEQIDNELRQIDDKLDKAQNKEIQLKKQLPIEENKLKEKERDFQSLQNEHVKYTNSIENVKREKSALENTVTFLNQQLEEEKAKRDEIKNIYDELVSEREEIKRNIENGEKQLEKILPPLDEEINTSQGKLDEAQKGLDNEKAWINFYNAPLAQEYKFKNKKEAYQRLKQLGEEYREFRENPSSSKWTDKEAERMRFVVKHYKAWQAAKEIGIADSRLYNEQFDTDNDYEYQEAIKYLQQHKQREEEIYKEIENEVQQLQDKINKLKQQKEQLNKQLSSNPRKAQEDNRKAIEKKETELSSSDINISKLEKQKQQNETKLAQINQDIEQNQETDEDKARYEERLKQLEEERNTQKKIYNETKKNLQEAQQQQIDLDNRQVELEEKKDQLLEKQKQAEEKLEIKRKEEEQRRKEEAERAAQEAKEHVKKEENAEKEQTEKTEAKKDVTSTSDTSTPPSIPPEQLKRILDLLENIQKALGTLEDGSDIPSITQSIKGMADALKELSIALGEIKQKNFNLNIGLPNNNPIGQQGEAKRKILKELEQQYNELNSYFVNKYGDDSSAFNALSKLEGGSNYIATMMSDYSVIGDTNASLSDKIEVYKTLIEQLRNFLIQEGGDINKVLTNVLSPEEIVNKITDDIAKLNPTTAISKIFEDIKVSIDASMAQINTESKGFNFLSGSAEEAAEAKRKFVEANKEVLQSIVASMPKIEQEAKALEKVEDTNSAKSSTSKKENNIEKDIKAEEEKNIELLRIQEARNAIYEQNSFMELEQQKRIEDIKKKELQTALQQNRQQEQVNDFNINKTYTKNDKQNRHELVQNQGKQIQLDVQKEKIEQAKKNYQSELEQARLIEQSEQIRNKSIQDSIKTQKAYSDISEQGLQLQENIQKKRTEQNQKQIQLELEQGRFIEQSLSVQQKKNQDKIKEYEDQLQLYAWDEKGEVDGQLSFLSVIDQNTHDLGEEYKQIIQEEKARVQKIADEEAKNKPINIPIEGQISFVTNNDINQIGQMINRYTETGREQIEKQFASLSKKEGYINSELNVEKILNPFGNLSLTENTDKLIEIDEKIRNIKAELSSSFDSDGKLIGDPQRVFELIKQFNNLITEVKKLKAEINSPTSQENIALQLAKDTEKAKKELNDLKQEVNEFFKNKSNKIIEADANKTINSYGALDANGNVIPIDKLSMDNIRPDDSIKLKEQQENVINLKHALDEYIISVEKLKQLNESDTVNLKELKQANEEVELLKDKVNNLIKITKKGTTNATGKEVSGLTNKIESLLGSDANLSDDVSNKLKNYLDILKSGATISKASYESMKADVQQFSAEQKKSFSIWDMMTLKMKEGIAFLATKFSFYQIFNQFRQGFEVIHQFDDALTEMMKVSDETRQSLEAYQKTTFATADAIGSNALQIQNSTADFMRLGESLKEASESAKTANILMNVSEFQSIDEATKSLIAMSAAYDDLSKMQIIDKLNEVGNNYSISTSGAAEALQASASALRTAGNDMDEALALVTAGNQIVQDVSKAGNGLRTIALRLTGTKSAKEELEELGEDTDSLITTQSKLRDTIKEATAVASNQFKGFDILDDNGNYKSTYEIMLGIAQIYQEIVDTDKELGRNNANLLLETVAGKTRANIAASIFQSPDVLEAAYKSSQGAQDSAMRENEKYIESISGHLAQLTNQWQEMWANAANREVINFFIDIGKNLLAIANTLGVIPTSLALIALYLNVIKKGAEGKTLTKAIKGILVGLSDMEGKAGEAGAALLSLGSGLKTSFSAIIPILGGVATAIGIVGTAAYAYYQHQKQVQKELVNSAKTANSEWQQQKQTLSEYSSQYEELKNKLDTGNLSEQETIEIKQKIYDIQKQITDQYGNTANKIDLINGQLNEQLLLIDNISQAEADRIWYSDDYQKGFELAKKAMTTESEYGLSMALDFENYKTPEDKALSHIIQKYTQERNYGRDSGQIGTYRAIVGNPVEADERMLKMMEEIEKLQEQNPYNKDLQKRAENVTSFLKQYRDDIGKIRQDNESAYLEGLPIELLATRAYKDYEVYSDYQSSVSNLEDAYITGDTQKINEARKAFDEATKAKNDFLEVGDNGQFALLFDKIDTSLINTKNRFRDTVELFKDIPVPEEKEGLFGGTDKKTLKDNAKAQSKLTKEQKKAYKAAEKLYKLNPDKVDIQATLKDNTYASGKYADALKALMDAMGWTTADADSLISALVTAGIVHGDAADVAYMASDSYNAFSSSVESAIGVLNTLNTALTESAKGTGLTEQTLTELKAAFGDNLDSVLERTANGYHLNTQGAYLLRQEQEAMVKADYASSMYEQYQALDKLQEGYLKAKAAGEDTSGFIQQREAIQNNIDKLNEDLMAFNNANSAYQTWLAKQNSEGEREMYNSVYSGYDAVKDELERGWAGEKTRSWLDLIFNDENEDWDAWTSSAEKIKEKFDEVTKDIKGTGGYSIADFFTVDANGKTTSQGVWNFFDAIQNKQKEVGKEFVNLEEGWFDFTENGDYQIAEMLGMDIESVHSILRAAADAGFEIHLDQPLFSLEQLKEKAISAKEALEETTGTELKINLDPKSEGEVDDAMQKLMDYQQSLSKDTSLEPKVKTERLQQVADLLNFMAAKKREFVEGKLFDFKVFDSKELETSKKNINDIVNKLSSYSKEAGKTDFSEQFTIDPMLLNNVDYLQEKINTLKEIRPNVDDTQVQYLDQLLAQLQYRVNLLNKSNISGDSITVDQFMAAEKVVDDINSKLDYAAQHKDIEFNWDADEEFKEELNTIANLPEEVKQKWGLEPDATGEELLELAKKGELHINVKTSGDTPKSKDTQTTNTQTNNVINKTTTISEEQVKKVVTTSMDTSPFDKGAKHVQEENKKIDKQKPEPKVGMDSKEFKKGSDDVNKQTKELDNKKATPSVALVGKNQVINDAQAMKSAIDSVKSKTISVAANFYYTGLSGMKSAIQSVLNKANELASSYTAHFANGTAHAHGTAFVRGSIVSNHAYAGGKWGLPNDQTALTGELGTEIVVRDGNWFTVGEDGAEFVNLKKGDINKIVSIYSDVYIINHLIAGNP